MEKTTMLKRMIAALSLAAATAMATSANAAVACAVADPTGTPLNVRNAPNGTILGALNNDAMVMVKDSGKKMGQGNATRTRQVWLSLLQPP
jgi:hypothetical protein